MKGWDCPLSLSHLIQISASPGVLGDFCARGGRGRVKARAVWAVQAFSCPWLVGSVQGGAGGKEAGAGLALRAGLSQEWEHLRAGSEQGVCPESEPFHPSQAGGTSPMPSCSAAPTCAEHPQTPSSCRSRAEAGVRQSALIPPTASPAGRVTGGC